MDKKKINILLVDDEEEFLSSLSERLQLRGFEPKTASDGEQAIEMARKEKFDNAIVDLRMPGIDGIVTITKMKETNPKIKTVLLTGYGSDKIKQATEGLDSDYFEKSKLGSFW